MLPQLLGIEVSRFVHELIQGAIVWTLLEGNFVGKFQPNAGSQFFYGFGKAEPVVFHQEAQSAAVSATAEAMIELFTGADGKRGGFFVVKRAARLIFATCSAQGNALVDNINHIDPSQQVVNKLWRDLSGHPGSLAGISQQVSA